MKTLSRIILAAFFLAVSFAGTTRAADENPQYEGIPSYSVTRLKIFEGSVWVRTPDSGEWEEFPNNSPVPERARISVPEDSEAELQFHGGQYMLLTGGTEVDLRRLEDENTVFRIRSGEIRFDLPEEDFSPVRVLIPNDARVDLPVPGKYWLTAPEDEDPRLVVRAGEGTVTTDRGETTVRRGEEARIGTDVRVGPYAGGPGEEGREETRLSEEEKQAGVPPAAADELRQYGEWVYSSEYGYVWRPRVAPGWTPYYYGQWDWISPYGWTWISYEPWGWYPYHYGYWYVDPLFGWVWYPFHSFVSVSFVFGHHHFHHFHRRAYFFPATVRFVRDGGTVRWVPLRPGERAGRVRFTRADRRLVRWERPLPARTVYVRTEGPKGREWTDWKAVRRGGSEDRRRRTDLRREDARRGDVLGEKVRRERYGKDVRERKDARKEAVGKRTGTPGGRTVAPERERIRDRTDRPARVERSDAGRGRIERNAVPPARTRRPPDRRMERTREPRVRAGSRERAVRPERVSAPPRGGGRPPQQAPVRGRERTVSPRVSGDGPRGQTRAATPGGSIRSGGPRRGVAQEWNGFGGGRGIRGGGYRGVR